MKTLGRRGLFFGAVPLTLPLAGSATAVSDAPLLAVIEAEPTSIMPGAITYAATTPWRRVGEWVEVDASLNVMSPK